MAEALWEHAIRDDEDYRQHLDYIHYNPVKHGLVESPKDWDYSSFRRFVDQGMYSLEWAANMEIDRLHLE